VELHLAGVLSDADRAAIPDGVPVVLHGYLPHAASVDLVRSADLLFLPMHDLEPGRRATIVPGKTYEYLASGRPILAAVPDGDARDLLAQADGVELTRPADAAAMAASIARVASQGARDYDRRTTMAPYERRELARRLADVLHGCAAERVA
jgi:glycosyltransferase involved in cell wall biosynthesis